MYRVESAQSSSWALGHCSSNFVLVSSLLDVVFSQYRVVFLGMHGNAINLLERVPLCKHANTSTPLLVDNSKFGIGESIYMQSMFLLEPLTSPIISS